MTIDVSSARFDPPYVSWVDSLDGLASIRAVGIGSGDNDSIVGDWSRATIASPNAVCVSRAATP